MRMISLSITSLLFACDPQKGNDTGDANDSGSIVDTQLDPNDYEAGCFVVDGGNGFAKLNDAMLFVETGSIITKCTPWLKFFV